MKDLKRLAATADFRNHPKGYLVLEFVDAPDGDVFGLVPKIDNDAVYLPSADAPAYRVALAGSSPDVLERAGKALLTLARNQKKVAAGEEVTDEDDAS